MPAIRIPPAPGDDLLVDRSDASFQAAQAFRQLQQGVVERRRYALVVRIVQPVARSFFRLAFADQALDRGYWPGEWMFSLGLVIGGGTSHIQKNIIAERGLKMPKAAR